MRTHRTHKKLLSLIPSISFLDIEIIFTPTLILILIIIIPFVITAKVVASDDCDDLMNNLNSSIQKIKTSISSKITIAIDKELATNLSLLVNTEELLDKCVTKKVDQKATVKKEDLFSAASAMKIKDLINNLEILINKKHTSNKCDFKKVYQECKNKSAENCNELIRSTDCTTKLNTVIEMVDKDRFIIPNITTVLQEDHARKIFEKWCNNHSGQLKLTDISNFCCYAGQEINEESFCIPKNVSKKLDDSSIDKLLAEKSSSEGKTIMPSWFLSKTYQPNVSMDEKGNINFNFNQKTCPHVEIKELMNNTHSKQNQGDTGTCYAHSSSSLFLQQIIKMTKDSEKQKKLLASKIYMPSFDLLCQNEETKKNVDHFTDGGLAEDCMNNIIKAAKNGDIKGICLESDDNPIDKTISKDLLNKCGTILSQVEKFSPENKNNFIEKMNNIIIKIEKEKADMIKQRPSGTDVCESLSSNSTTIKKLDKDVKAILNYGLKDLIKSDDTFSDFFTQYMRLYMTGKIADQKKFNKKSAGYDKFIEDFINRYLSTSTQITKMQLLLKKMIESGLNKRKFMLTMLQCENPSITAEELKNLHVDHINFQKHFKNLQMKINFITNALANNQALEVGVVPKSSKKLSPSRILNKESLQQYSGVISSTSGDGHSMVIDGMRFEKGKCQVHIKNSYGENIVYSGWRDIESVLRITTGLSALREEKLRR
ncbi:MAG: hypothetical protein HQK51_04870 [Oligoflexia bacterium]|nr:hypothetical protein [Oligoflexia bacterium]